MAWTTGQPWNTRPGWTAVDLARKVALVSIRISLLAWWARAAVYACWTLLAVAVTAIILWPNRDLESSPGRVVAVGSESLITGALLATTTRRLHDAYTATLSRIPPTDRSAAITAIWRGPIPIDPAARDTAAQVGEIYLGALPSSEAFCTAVVVGVGAVPAQGTHASLAALGSYLAVCAVAGVLWVLYAMRRVGRRVSMLTDTVGPVTAQFRM